MGILVSHPYITITYAGMEDFNSILFTVCIIICQARYELYTTVHILMLLRYIYIPLPDLITFDLS